IHQTVKRIRKTPKNGFFLNKSSVILLLLHKKPTQKFVPHHVLSFLSSGQQRLSKCIRKTKRFILIHKHREVLLHNYHRRRARTRIIQIRIYHLFNIAKLPINSSFLKVKIKAIALLRSKLIYLQGFLQQRFLFKSISYPTRVIDILNRSINGLLVVLLCFYFIAL